MKANELMIGDWIVYRGDTEYTNPVRIDGMDIRTCSLITEDREDVGFDGIEPIPITPEILKKNGFKDGQFFAELLCGEWQILCDCSHIAMRHMAGWSVDIPCGYIHELQHALRLCGIEKEIEL